MYMNFWYPAAESAKVTDTPVHVRMLGLDFVVFRDAGGEARVLSNICVHRGAALSEGKVKGNCVECPYHGWQFDGDGKCLRIPSMGPDAKIPARAKIDAYPTQERYGLIFAFLGDLPEEERPPIMDVPEWEQEGWRATLVNYQWKANYRRVMENTLDPSHTEFVHSGMGFSGDREEYHTPKLDEIESDWGSGTMTTFVSPALPDSKMREHKKEAGEMEAGAGNHGPSQAWVKIHFSPTAWTHQYMFETPIDEHNLNIWLLNVRNIMVEPEHDERINGRNMVVAEEDRIIVERMDPIISPEVNAKEVIVPADNIMIRYREWLNEWQAKGWRIDSDAVDTAKGKQAFAIPSPARRESKGWAIDPVPVLAPKQKMKQAAE